MKNKFLKIIAIHLLLFFVYGCSLPRVVEQSHDDKPNWVHGLERGYIIANGSGHSYQEAQNSAFRMLRERIVSSVAVSISSESQIEISEQILENISKYTEVSQFRTVITTDFLNSLQGVSLSKVEDYYWEKKRYPEKQFEIHYHIKYPMPDEEINNLMQQWSQMDKAFTAEIDKLEKDIDNTESVYELISFKEKAKALTGIFTGTRKTKAELLHLRADQLLKNLGLQTLSHDRGSVLVKLSSMGKDFDMESELSFTSSCASLFQSKLVDDAKYLRVIYDPDFCCPTTDQATFSISQNYGEYTLFSIFDIPPPDDEIRFVVSEPISLNVSHSYIKQITDINIPFRVFTDIKFIITKIELVLNRSSKYGLRELLTGSERQSYIHTNHNQKIEKKGDHNIKFSISSVRDSELERFLNTFFTNSSSLTASGKIYFRPAGKKQEYSVPFQSINVVEYR